MTTTVIWDERTKRHVEIGRSLARDIFRGSDQPPSIGQEFVSSPVFMARGGQTGDKRSIDVSCRGSILPTTRAGFNSSDLSAVNVAPQQGFVTLGTQRLTIQDLIAPGSTNAAAIPYPLESSVGVGTAETVGERGLKPHWEPDIDSGMASVRKIAVTTKIPDEMLADFDGLASFIDARMPYMVAMETERQFLYGDGLGTNIKGIASTAGILTRPFVGTWGDTVMKAITDIHVGSNFMPDGIAIHPNDLEVAGLEKDENGQYLAGGPVSGPYGVGSYTMPTRMWGLPLVVTTSITPGRPIIGAWRLGAQYFVREGAHITATNSNEDDFRRNMVALRCETRVALAVYRPSCFCEISGGPARD